jgi:signal transduction histidine kinase
MKPLAALPTTNVQEQVPAWLLDLLLGIAVTLVIALVITADQGGRQRPDLLAYLFAAGFGGLMLVRRHFPVVVLVMTMLLLFAYYALGYPAIGLAVPVSAALYSAAELGRLQPALLVSLLLIIVSTYFRVLDGQSLAFLLGYELISAVTMMAAAIALGDSMRARRALRAEQEQTAQLIAQEHAYRAEQRVQAERVRMARDLHDVIGHSISVISLQADVAREALGRSDDDARQALTHIRAATTETMRELRATVKLLRNPDGEQPERALTTLANLTTLVNQAQASGLQVAVRQSGNLAQLPATVDSAAYRIVQEALTNVIRHANATAVVIAIAVDERALHVCISDNGTTAPATVVPGSGLVGMNERARLLGGALRATPEPTGGFTVEATLPLEKER